MKHAGFHASIILIALIFLGLCAACGVCQQQTNTSSQPAVPADNWVWGEVVSVDNAGQQLTIRFLDETGYQDEDMVIRVDDQTEYEGVTTLLEIKPFDTVVIDYAASALGGALARKIAVSTDGEDGLHETMPDGITGEKR